MSIRNLTTAKDYDDYVKSEDLTVVHFEAPWAEQCAQINDILEVMTNREEYKNVRFCKIIAENVPEVSLKAGISAVPTVLLLRNNNIVDRIDGANPAELRKKIQKHLGPAGDKYLQSNECKLVNIPQTEENLEARLKRLINQAPCMLFMKGNRENPRCGFSRTMVSILDSYKAQYSTFDILEDNAVREGLKTFSNWPTYPQLYINGNLLGGLDIVTEMSDNGDLEEMLSTLEDKETS